MLPLDVWREDKVLDRALVELEGEPAHGLVEAHLAEEGEPHELTLLVNRRIEPGAGFC